MTFDEAVRTCAVRSAIYRTKDPKKVFTMEDFNKIEEHMRYLYVNMLGTYVPKRYWKNHTDSLYVRIPKEDQEFTDWEEYDPREDDYCSLSCYND